jgi:hypothetical protein
MGQDAIRLTDVDGSADEADLIVLRSVRRRLAEAQQLLRHMRAGQEMAGHVHALIVSADLAVCDLANALSPTGAP